MDVEVASSSSRPCACSEGVNRAARKQGESGGRPCARGAVGRGRGPAADSRRAPLERESCETRLFFPRCARSSKVGTSRGNSTGRAPALALHVEGDCALRLARTPRRRALPLGLCHLARRKDRSLGSGSLLHTLTGEVAAADRLDGFAAASAGGAKRPCQTPGRKGLWLGSFGLSSVRARSASSTL